MSNFFRPADATELRDVIAWAVAEEEPVEIIGRGTKRVLGRPMQCPHLLDLSGLAGVSLYEPEELVLTAGAGTPLADIEALLEKNHQHLAFEPADLGPLFGGDPGQATIGGVLACNLSGPGRIKAGAARDHILGVKGVSGRGEAFKSGGRVVKNVTGYDLSKLIAGSFGTLAAMTELTLKVMPAAEKTYTVLIYGLDDEAALRVMGEAARSSHEVSGLAHLPRAVAARSAVSYVGGAGASVTALRTAGPGPSVEHRTGALREMFAGQGAVEELHSQNSAVLWREVRDCAGLLGVAGSDGMTVWRLSVPPAQGADVVATVMSATGGEAYYDWAGGLIWLALGSDKDGASHDVVRRAVAPTGGHGLLVRADAAVRERVPVFQPQPEPLARLTRRVKQSFDPKRVLNRGRMYAEL